VKYLSEVDPEIFEVVSLEIQRQHENIELIASENFASPAVLEATGSVLTNKYAEGYPGRRWYGGCEHVDVAERLVIERAKKLFGAEHVNAQPHSGSSANLAAYFALLKPGDSVLAMSLAHGGHLTHGHPMNFSGKLFRIIPYGVSKKDERLDYDEIESLAKKHKPKMILVGASAYSRVFDFDRFRKIADQVKAFLMVDMAHFAGLVAAGIHPNPVPVADVVTTTTHKTLRGPRAGLILCRNQFAKAIDLEVFPGTQGGPLMHVIAAKAVALKEADTDEFRNYQKQIVLNAQTLAKALADKGFRIVSGGTDNHLMLVDVTSKSLTGKDSAIALDRARITVNKNAIPFDTKSPFVASGIRLGTPAVTTRGMKEGEMTVIADFIQDVLTDIQNEEKIVQVAKRVGELVERFPLYEDLRKETGVHSRRPL